MRQGGSGCFDCCSLDHWRGESVCPDPGGLKKKANRQQARARRIKLATSAGADPSEHEAYLAVAVDTFELGYGAEMYSRSVEAPSEILFSWLGAYTEESGDDG